MERVAAARGDPLVLLVSLIMVAGLSMGLD
jgi:hypothetical protein